MTHHIPPTSHQLTNYLKANLRGFLGRENNIPMQEVIAHKTAQLFKEYSGNQNIVEVKINGIDI